MSDQPKSSPQLEQGTVSDESIQAVHAQLLREKAEPVEGYAPLPLLLLALLATLIFFAAIYLERFSGHFEPMVYNESARGVATSGPVQIDPVARGKSLFVGNCAQCHQVTGQGIPGIYPPLAGSEFANGSEEAVVRIVLHGLTGPLTVEGKQFNNTMPAFGATGYAWTDAKISWVLTYVRQEWGNKAPAVTEETVTRIRAATADQKGPFGEGDVRPLIKGEPSAPATP